MAACFNSAHLLPFQEISFPWAHAVYTSQWLQLYSINMKESDIIMTKLNECSNCGVDLCYIYPCILPSVNINFYCTLRCTVKIS